MERELPVRVTTTLCGNAGGGQKTIDWKNKSDRKWLTNHLTWAVTNSAVVELTRI